MARSRSKAAEATDNRETDDVFDQQIAARAEAMQNRPVELPAKTGEIIQSVADSMRLPYEQPSHASQHAPAARTVERKKYTPLPDPMGFENIKGSGENRVRLLKSEGEGAWVIRFAHNPNDDQGLNGETYSKEKPHPVLKMLKDAGFRWGFDGGDGKGGWGKGFTDDAYGQDHIEARAVLQQAAELIGATTDQSLMR
jgi:hypothetical protein